MLIAAAARRVVRTSDPPKGILGENVRLDFTLGSWRKQRTGMRRPISAHPMPCNQLANDGLQRDPMQRIARMRDRGGLVHAVVFAKDGYSGGRQ